MMIFLERAFLVVMTPLEKMIFQGVLTPTRVVRMICRVAAAWYKMVTFLKRTSQTAMKTFLAETNLLEKMIILGVLAPTRVGETETYPERMFPMMTKAFLLGTTLLERMIIQEVMAPILAIRTTAFLIMIIQHTVENFLGRMHPITTKMMKLCLAKVRICRVIRTTFLQRTTLPAMIIQEVMAPFPVKRTTFHIVIIRYVETFLATMHPIATKMTRRCLVKVRICRVIKRTSPGETIRHRGVIIRDAMALYPKETNQGTETFQAVMAPTPTETSLAAQPMTPMLYLVKMTVSRAIKKTSRVGKRTSRIGIAQHAKTTFPDMIPVGVVNIPLAWRTIPVTDLPFLDAITLVVMKSFRIMSTLVEKGTSRPTKNLGICTIPLSAMTPRDAMTLTLITKAVILLILIRTLLVRLLLHAMMIYRAHKKTAEAATAKTRRIPKADSKARLTSVLIGKLLIQWI
mmetsp:Transcript_14688/g.27879  ORF Transcript_14688/g.27879 Transcript_14688/m.27879 type:complete len:458 (-) Transcript_14688:5913-7286(-)